MPPRTALLAGATGLVGALLLDRLLYHPAYDRVVVIARRPLAPSPKLDVRVVDFERLGAADLPGGIDDAFVALGTTMRKAGSRDAFRRVDLDHVVAVARSARERGARQLLLVSALGASRRSPVFYNRVKGEAEEAARAIGFPSFHAFRPSILLGERAERRPGERAGIAIVRAVSPVLVGPLRRYRPTPAGVLADAMIAVALRDDPGAFVHDADEVAGHGPTTS